MSTGFNFGTSGPAGAPADTSGFSFSGASNAAPALAPTAFSGFGNASASASTGAPAPSTATQPVSVPDFDERFPYLKINDKLNQLVPKTLELSPDGRLAGQQLVSLLSTDAISTGGNEPNGVSFGLLLAKPVLLTLKRPDVNLRQRLKSDPHVLLDRQRAALDQTVMEDLWKLSDSLRISEVDAMALYAHANRNANRLKPHLEDLPFDTSLESSTQDATLPARILFFYERGLCLESLHLIMLHRLQAKNNPENSYLLQASDKLLQADLVGHLVTMIRDLSRLAEELEQDLHSTNHTAPSMFATSTATVRDTRQASKFTSDLLVFSYQQRQRAAECLFLIAYHTQCTAGEVGSMIALVKELTNGTQGDVKSGLPLLDPFLDVPNAYRTEVATTNAPGHPFGAAALREKDPLEWEQELVESLWKKGGKPLLLECVSMLVLSILCALDARHDLLDRETHRVNAFGKGNALLPPSTDGKPVSTDHLLPIHHHLDPSENNEKEWKRKDIWGVMIAGYALLLRSLSAVASSPRLGGSPSFSSLRGGSTRIDIKTTWRACLYKPATFKSFTCIRLCLMPSIRRHKDTPDRYEIYMAVLSEFMSHYLNVLTASGDVPISREQWEKSEDDDLQLRRRQQEQRSQFRDWSNAPGVAEEAVPREVNLLERPDCMDDVMALAIALCACGPEHALFFWSTRIAQDKDGKTTYPELSRSRALQKLDRMQELDASLRPTYVSFLAALAIASAPKDGRRNGAAAVHEILSQDPIEDSQITWVSILKSMRWYTRLVSPSDYGAASSTTKSTADESSSISGMGSTAYYYGADDFSYEGYAGGFESSSRRSKSAANSSENRAIEMGEENEAILLSHLGVIATVARNHPPARSFLMKLPIASSDLSSVVGEDPTLTVLLLLSLVPLTPSVRGAVFGAVASLIRTDDVTSTEEANTIHEMAQKCWKLVEACRILPISHLDQFGSYPDASARDTQGMLFPPSSTSLVGEGGRGAWLRPEPKYGIIFELEHIESRQGTYPSTEGFLQLLTALFSAGHCPSDLGQGSRFRPGCTPYIEYVTDFVLPRIIGTRRNSTPIPFRKGEDKNRLLCRALQVVQAVLTRYTVVRLNSHAYLTPSTSASKNRQAGHIASELFGLPSLAEKLVMLPPGVELADLDRDFRDATVSQLESVTESRSTQIFGTAERSTTFSSRDGDFSLPVAKSPGFTILSDVLCSSQGETYKALVKTLTDFSEAEGGPRQVGRQAFEFAVAKALFGDLQPTLKSARFVQEGSTLLSRQSLLAPLLPPLEHALGDEAVDAVQWGERSIILAFRIFCAAVFRESDFLESVSVAHTLLRKVPVLRFSVSKQLQASEVSVSTLADILTSCGGMPDNDVHKSIFPAIVRYLGYEGTSVEQEADVASGALALFSYVSRSIPANESLRIQCGNSLAGMTCFAKAMAIRLVRSALHAEEGANAELAGLILDSILRTLHSPSQGAVSLAHILLRLPYVAPSGTLVFGSSVDGEYPSESLSVEDCFDAILLLLSSEVFVTSPVQSELAAKCYEVIYRLSNEWNVDESSVHLRASLASDRLSSSGFWEKNLLRFFAKRGEPSHCLLHYVSSEVSEGTLNWQYYIFHCISWLLKGLSNELVASHRKMQGFYQFGWHESSQTKNILGLLFTGDDPLMSSILHSFPVQARPARFDKQGRLVTFVEDSSKNAEVQMVFDPDVCPEYPVYELSKMESSLPDLLTDKEKETVLREAREWNLAVAGQCAVSHLSSALRILFESSLFLADILNENSEKHSSFQPSIWGIFSMDPKYLLHLLHVVLRRFEHDPSPTTSYDFAFIALLLVEKIVSIRDCFDVGNFESMCSLLADATVVSASHEIASVCVQKQNAGTAALGTALALMVKAIPEGTSMPNAVTHIVPAIFALGELACAGNGRQPGSHSVLAKPPNEAVTYARLSFSSLVDIYRKEDGLEISRLLHTRTNCCASGILESLVALIPSFDPEICVVLEKIVQCPGGPSLVLNSSVLPALIESGKIYTRIEREAYAKLQHHDAIEMPAFFPGHLHLLRTLITSDIPVSQRKRLSSDAMTWLLCYTDVVHRLLEGGVERQLQKDCVECFVAAAAAGGMSDKINDHQFAVWEKQILSLASRLSESPLPQRLLPNLPAKLNQGNSQLHIGGIVSVSRNSDSYPSWWDTFESTDEAAAGAFLPDPPSLVGARFGASMDSDCGTDGRWTDQHYEAALLGMQTLDICLAFMILRGRHFEEKPLALQWLVLARGLSRFADIARATQGRLYVLKGETDSGPTTGAFRDEASTNVRRMEEMYLVKWGALVGRCAEKILCLVWRQMQSEPTSGENDANWELVAAVLDHTRMSSMGIGCVVSKKDGSVRNNAAKEIAKRIEIELDRLQK